MVGCLLVAAYACEAYEELVVDIVCEMGRHKKLRWREESFGVRQLFKVDHSYGYHQEGKISSWRVDEFEVKVELMDLFR